MNALSITISGISIHQDEQSRYCLNDFHKASGEDKKHQPANFLRLESTKELIEELNHSSDLRSAVDIVNGGNNPGTFVVKELVYAYAMWISPKFHLHVIRAYDSLVKHGLDDLKHLEELAKTQKLLIDSQLGEIANIKEKSGQLFSAHKKLVEYCDFMRSTHDMDNKRARDQLARCERALKPITTQERDEVVAKYKSGSGVHLLARHFYRSPAIIRRTLREAGELA